MSAALQSPPPAPREIEPAPHAAAAEPPRDDAAPPAHRFDAVNFRALLSPLIVAALLLGLWSLAVRISETDNFPGPLAVLLGIWELAERGLLVKYVVASLFRVTFGFGLAVLVGIPFGLAMGWFKGMYEAFNPIIQILRPISPIAWIPIAILWFGITDAAPVFMIFLASVFPISVSAAAAVQNLQPVYLRAARNFGLTRPQLFRLVILPAAMPQIITGLRIALGIAWLVVVAAEMIARDTSGGLGYLINDARNAGKRYDLVVAGMVLIGLIGLILDLLVRRLERFDSVQWGYSNR